MLLLDEPTRGIDVGSKAEIYRLIGELAAHGKAVLFVSSYLPELLGVCDRIAVMSRGRLGEARPAADWSEASLLEARDGECDMADTRAHAAAGTWLGPFAGSSAWSRCSPPSSPETFPSVYNLQTIAAQTVIVGLGAIGMTFVIVSGGIDLSVGSVIALSSVVTALALRDGHGAAAVAAAGRRGRRRAGRRWSTASLTPAAQSCRSSSRSARWASRAGSPSTSPASRRSTRPPAGSRR